ncbi:major facilitator superfamily domain-containing protein 4A isoform X2 [Exaiptasia diaphana]|uniref:Major facilitator superfamily domain-containing protein 4A n=1 Tax=Exaiptasia diaphana TaxID=2652724 RepID=A0A913YKH3_EXADI|nr:major facilitator superfamily domain-containing protein 4A isoform X2 [Exaiptasia diaphana]
MIRQLVYLALWKIWTKYSRKSFQLHASCTSKFNAVVQNGLYFSTFFMFGMSVGMAGPTLMDFLASYFKEYDAVNALSWLLFVQSATRFIGAIFAGFLIDRFECNRNLMLLVCLTLNAVFLAVIPMCRELWLLILTTAAAGYCVGVLDTATNVQLLALHGKKVSPYLQALYFSYGFGAFVSPLIAEPFLSGQPHPEIVTKRREKPMPYGGGKHRHHHSTHPNLTDGISMDDQAYSSEVQFAYWIIAIAHVPVVIGLAYLVMLDMFETHQKKSQQTKTTDQPTDKEVEVTEPKEAEHSVSLFNSPNRCKIFGISLWTCLLVFLYDGMQGTYGGYIYTYAVKSSLKMKPAQGAFLTSIFWGSLALGRLISIPIAMFISPAAMLFGDLAGTIAASFLMLIFKDSAVVLWIGTSTFGLFMSNVFPSSVALVEQYFEVTGSITCMFVVSAAIGEMVIPLIVGKVFDYIGPISFLAEGCILCVAALGSLLAVLIIGKGLSNTHREKLEISDEDISDIPEDKKPVEEDVIDQQDEKR